jgi:hypothetical protein
MTRISFTGLMIAVMSALFAVAFVAAGYRVTGMVFVGVGFSAALVAFASAVQRSVEERSAEIRDRIR